LASEVPVRAHYPFHRVVGLGTSGLSFVFLLYSKLRACSSFPVGSLFSVPISARVPRFLLFASPHFSLHTLKYGESFHCPLLVSSLHFLVALGWVGSAFPSPLPRPWEVLPCLIHQALRVGCNGVASVPFVRALRVRWKMAVLPGGRFFSAVAGPNLFSTPVFCKLPPFLVPYFRVTYNDPLLVYHGANIPTPSVRRFRVWSDVPSSPALTGAVSFQGYLGFNYESSASSFLDSRPHGTS